MYPLLPARLSLVSRASVKKPCRFIAHRRFPLPTRGFHASRVYGTAPHDSENVSDSPLNSTTNGTSPNSEPEQTNAPVAGASTTQIPPIERPTSEQDNNAKPYGSATRRALRNRKGKELKAPVAIVPQWFLDNNVVSQRVPAFADSANLIRVGIENYKPEVEEQVKDSAQGGDGGEGNGPDDPATSENRYILSQALWEELHASARAGLHLPPAKYSEEPFTTRSHLILQYPGEGGMLFLDAVVKKLASDLKANLVTLNVQDIAELCCDQEQDIAGPSGGSMRGLGYDIFPPPKNFRTSGSPRDVEGAAEQDEGDDMVFSEDDSADSSTSRQNPREAVFARAVPIGSFSGDFSDLAKPSKALLQGLFGGFGGGGSGRLGKVVVSRDGDKAGDSPFRPREGRWYGLVNELLSTPTKSRQNSSEPTNDGSVDTKSKLPGNAKPDLLVQIQDYKELQDTREGSMFLKTLYRAIQSRRTEGQRILLIGAVSSKDHEFLLNRSYPSAVQGIFDDDYSRTIVVTPAMNSQQVEEIFTQDQKRRTTEINIRHLQEFLRLRLHDMKLSDDSIMTGRAWPVDGLDNGYWPFYYIHRISNLALGFAEQAGQLEVQHIQRAIEIVDESDKVKSDWIAEKHPKQKQTSSEPDREARLQILRSTCNTHEKKLLNGVVDAANIRTTFSDVHAPSETITALKTLTSLSLIRPEAFKYGVLATDKMPGLLLYGPPGTGKTMLAKAVARESGATVLEVSGSDIYDMYVGEGEKNVRAIFSLAKKLSPCVVFIDEADAIFCSRTGSTNRSTHRELINQFLKEWDGMSDLSAFIMVATNRPFDLDDAVLRRLPRRLLVDLPTEQDRQSILKIHLKDEVLDPSVDLVELARTTPLYSGSDLKNMCVAAALACVREENEVAAKHQGPEPYSYPDRRVLTAAHFDRAMEEISASISEDMSSLSAVKKFDEKYGDRKGRRKKGPGWGFVPANEPEVVETGRVRT